tara:strand:- start:579 stop:1154 length:576 start_codon:yes stop_codon:yes gene_type:complete
MKHYVIGNGTSRLIYNIDKLEGIKYGCNAIYRNYWTDYLVCKDKRICTEILTKECWRDRKVIMQTRWLAGSEWREAYKKVFWWKDLLGTIDFTDCGTVALRLACKNANEDDEIYMYGMDYDDPNNNKVNNVYYASLNYSSRKNQRKGVTKEFLETFNKYPNLKFVHVNDKWPWQLDDKKNVRWLNDFVYSR